MTENLWAGLDHTSSRNCITLGSRDKLIKIEKLFTPIQMIKGKFGSE